MRRFAIAALLGFFGSAAIAADSCPPPPAPVVDLASNRFYSDRQNSIIDPVLWEKRKAAVKPLEDYRAELARFASRGFAGNAHWAACAGSWLHAWAVGGALLGRMSETQAQYERKWALASFAMAYIRVKPALPPEQRMKIEAWIGSLAEAVDAHYRTHLKGVRNNHYYWLGFALAASDLATGGDHYRRRASSIFSEALAHIEKDGHLPLEAARGAKALHYHNFSAFPLVMMAEIAARRGEDWYGRENGALHRLAALTFAGMQGNQTMERIAGVRQEKLEPRSLSWLPFYARRFPGRLDVSKDILAGRFWSGFAGGDIGVLAQAWVQ